MRPESFRRRLASLILRCAIQITPAANLDWARAILGELNEVEGDWAAQLWAIGGASLLAKQALLSMLLPNSEGVTVAPGGEAFAKEASVSRATLTLSALCASAVLALFLSPSFRQGFQLS